MEDNNNALSKQVGGNHYKKLAIQPVEFITEIGCSFIQGSIIKYISRYRFKGKAEDIKKCIHFAELAIQLRHKHNTHWHDRSLKLNIYILRNCMSIGQRKVITAAIYNHWNEVIKHATQLLQEEYPAKERE